MYWTYTIFTPGVLILFLACSAYSRRSEPSCGQFEYDEKLLSKMIRTEIDVENLTKKIEVLETSLETAITALKKQDGVVRKTVMLTKKIETLENSLKTTIATFEKHNSDIRESVQALSKDEIRQTSQRIGFTVKAPYVKGSALSFRTIESNYGNSFNETTGKFVCSVPGLYQFSTTLVSSSIRSICWIKVGSNRKTVAIARTKTAGTFPSGSASRVYQLNAGDEVYLECNFGSTNVDSQSHFSGILVH